MRSTESQFVDTVRGYHPAVPKDAFPAYPRSPEHLPDGDPIGRDAMSRITGRSKAAVDKWVERESLPLADGPDVDGPTWRRRTFLGWAYQQGYLLALGTEDPLPEWAEGREWAASVPRQTLVPVRELRIAGFGPWPARWGDTDLV